MKSAPQTSSTDGSGSSPSRLSISLTGTPSNASRIVCGPSQGAWRTTSSGFACEPPMTGSYRLGVVAGSTGASSGRFAVIPSPDERPRTRLTIHGAM
jgi:hypothetical protein